MPPTSIEVSMVPTDDPIGTPTTIHVFRDLHDRTKIRVEFDSPLVAWTFTGADHLDEFADGFRYAVDAFLERERHANQPKLDGAA